MDTAWLKGRTAIVTGAGRGIGRAISKRLAAAGANVVLVARTAQQIEETRRIIVNNRGVAIPIAADVSDADAVENMAAEAHERFGTIDILVNNAGAAPLAGIAQMEPHLFDSIIAANVRSVYLCSRTVWPYMTANHGGIILNISSVAAFDPFPGFAAYGAAKAFVNVYTKALAAEGAPIGIRVYGIAPGAVDTQMLRGTFPDFPADKTLAPDEVASLAEWMLLPNTRYISGQVVVIRKD